MNRIYQNIIIIPLILLCSICNTSFASINPKLESHRLDSNNLVTQKLNDGKIAIDFVTDQLTSLKNATLSVNNITLNSSTYHIDCKVSENPTACTIAINPARSLPLNGKFILRAANGDAIVTGNSNHELAFTLDKSNPSKLKISNSLTEQPVRIDMINGKPLTDSILNPLNNMIIDLPNDGILLECSIDGENLTYVVKKSNQTTAATESNAADTTDNQTIAILAAGGGVFIVGAGVGTLLHMLCQKRTIAKKYYHLQEDLIKQIKQKINDAEPKNTEAMTIALANCTGAHNQENMRIVKMFTTESSSRIAKVREYLIAHNSVMTLDALNIVKILDEQKKINQIADIALEYAENALKFAKSCHDGLIRQSAIEENYQPGYSNQHSSLDQTAQDITQLIEDNKQQLLKNEPSVRCSTINREDVDLQLTDSSEGLFGGLQNPTIVHEQVQPADVVNGTLQYQPYNPSGNNLFFK